MDALEFLSTDGVTGDLAKETDPERKTDYDTACRKWLDKVKERRKKKKKKNEKDAIVSSNNASTPTLQTITIDMIRKLVYILETNCHSSAMNPVNEIVAIEGDEEVEENVGLWLVGSLFEHACLPNATAVLRFTEEKATLTLRALSNIKKGDMITISYQDREYETVAERQASLLRRGFVCRCNACSLADIFRPMICSKESCIVLPATKNDETNWACISGHAIDKDWQEYAEEKEEALVDEETEGEILLAVVDAMMEHLSSAVDFSHTQATSQDVVSFAKTMSALIPNLNAALKNMLDPIHVCHASIYQFVRQNLFFNPNAVFIFKGQTSLACAFLVASNYWYVEKLGMNPYHEDLRHNLWWLALSAIEASSKNSASEGDLKQVAKVALNACLDQVMVLYGCEHEWYRVCKDKLASI